MKDTTRLVASLKLIVIAVIEGETMQEIGDLVTGKINPIAGISRVVTCLVI